MEHEVYIDSSLRFHYPEGASMLDGVPEELIEAGVLHEYWRQFPPQHPFLRQGFAIAIFCLWLLNFFGNGLVITMFSITKTLRTPTNMFIVSLAFSDLLMMSCMGIPVFINAFSAPYWMWGPKICRIYGAGGAIFGTCSINMMVAIAYDRYNVIVNGFNGTKITGSKAALIVLFTWIITIATCIEPFFGWGNYAIEGLLMTCSYDYLLETWNAQSFMIFTFFFNYAIQLVLLLYFYGCIVKAVVQHERSLREQAKKMNVDTLRSNQDAAQQKAELRVTKVAITNVFLWTVIWTPYCVVSMIPIWGNRALITPLVSQLPCFFAKSASCLNPVVFALSHPKYREVLQEKLPWLGIREEGSSSKTDKSSCQTQATGA